MESIDTSSAVVSKLDGFQMPKGATAAKPSMSEDDFDAMARAASAPAMGGDTEVAEKPMTYVERLAAFKVTPEQAVEIIDKLVVDGAYSEEIQLSKSVKIVLQTRSVRFNTYLADTIDIADPKKVGKLNQLMALYQIAGSLEQYGPAKMPPLADDLTPESWEKVIKIRTDFVNKLPSPVFLTLNSKLAEFDRKMMIIFSEGFEKNF